MALPVLVTRPTCTKRCFRLTDSPVFASRNRPRLGRSSVSDRRDVPHRIRDVRWLVRRGGVVAALAVFALMTLFMPWARSGSMQRSGYTLAHAVAAAGTESGAWERGLLDAVFVLPAVVGLICATSLVGRVRVAALLAALEGAVVVAASVAALTQLHASVEIGPRVGIVLGGLAVIGSLLQITRRRGRDVGYF